MAAHLVVFVFVLAIFRRPGNQSRETYSSKYTIRWVRPLQLSLHTVIRVVRTGANITYQVQCTSTRWCEISPQSICWQLQMICSRRLGITPPVRVVCLPSGCVQPPVFRVLTQHPWARHVLLLLLILIPGTMVFNKQLLSGSTSRITCAYQVSYIPGIR